MNKITQCEKHGHGLKEENISYKSYVTYRYLKLLV